jgi:hypothetical protein
MVKAYKGLAQAIALGVALQASFVALGWFLVMGDLEDGKTLTEDWEYNIGHILHSIVGLIVIPLLAIALLVVAFRAKQIADGVKLASFLLLAVVVQVALAFVSFFVPAIGALHGLNAILVLGIALAAAKRATSAEAGSAHAGAPATV